MTRIAVLILLLAVATLAAVPEAFADYYQYKDSSGVVNMTNELRSVPAKYRSTMKVIKDDAPAKRGPAAKSPQDPSAAQEEAAEPKQAPAAAPAPVPEGKFAQLSARFVWFKPIVYLALILAVFVAITKLTTLIPSAILSKLIYLCFFLGVFVFLYKAYVEHVVTSSLAVKEKAVNMMKKSNAREMPMETEAIPVQSVK